MQDLEDNLLLRDYLLGNKISHGGETSLYKFVELFNEEMNNNIATHSRQHDVKMHSAKCASIPCMIQCLTNLLLPDAQAPCLS